MEEWIAIAGREAVRQVITEHGDRFKLRFAPYKPEPYRTNAEILTDARKRAKGRGRRR